MKIATISDLHLEFGGSFDLSHIDADVLILAGDICTLNNLESLERLLETWPKYRPVLYVTGNHEYYTKRPMEEAEKALFHFMDGRSTFCWLDNDCVSLDGVQFFGGTMWTSMDGASPIAMNTAQLGMNDYYQIYLHQARRLRPEDTIVWHDIFVDRLKHWFEMVHSGPHVVISHHAPILNPKTKYKHSELQPCFNSLDMPQLIEKYQPDLWVYGHTHEADDQLLGKTRIISNPCGYHHMNESTGFDSSGKVVEILCADDFKVIGQLSLDQRFEFLDIALGLIEKHSFSSSEIKQAGGELMDAGLSFEQMKGSLEDTLKLAAVSGRRDSA